MILPKRIFFTGVPGSRWTMICQHLEGIPGMDTSDRQPHRGYVHHAYTEDISVHILVEECNLKPDLTQTI